MNSQKQISVLILTLNEERDIARCIDSILAVADEIVVVDSFSTDKTEEICKSYEGLKFIQNSFEGYIEQKDFAKKLAVHDIILSIDADEALSDELQESILNIKQNWTHDSYTMNRLSNYCGKWIKHSGWYPDIKLRIFDRSKGYWGGINPHDKIIMNKGATTFHLKGNIFHYSYYSIEEHKAQVVKFAEIAANSLYKNGVKASRLKLFYKPLARFVKSYIINAGFLDGREGLIIAKLTARSSFLRYKKLYQLQNKL